MTDILSPSSSVEDEGPAATAAPRDAAPPPAAPAANQAPQTQIARPAKLKPAAPEPEPSLSDRLRAVIPRSPFRDTVLQVQHHQYRAELFQELRVTLLLEGCVVDQLAQVNVELQRTYRAIEAGTDRKLLAAAREVLEPDIMAFHPPAPNQSGYTQNIQNAYDKYMTKERWELLNQPEAEVIAAAIAKLAEAGQDESDLRMRAYVLALPETLKLHELGERQLTRMKDLLNTILVLIERKEARAAARAAKEAA